MNANLLKGKMAEYGMTQEDVAKKVGISLSRFNAKLNETGGAEFSLGEVISLVKLFNLSSKQRDQIFLE